jgi:hypothetical protein
MCGYLCFAFIRAAQSSFCQIVWEEKSARHLFCPRKVRGPHLVAYGPGIVGSKLSLDQDMGSIPDKDIYILAFQEKS